MISQPARQLNRRSLTKYSTYARKLRQSVRATKQGTQCISHVFRVGQHQGGPSANPERNLSHARHISVFQFIARRCGPGSLVGQPGWLRRGTIAGTCGRARIASHRLRAGCLGRYLARLQCRGHGLDDPGDGKYHAGARTGRIPIPLIVGVMRTDCGLSASF
jgi:hypothetical protein